MSGGGQIVGAELAPVVDAAARAVRRLWVSPPTFRASVTSIARDLLHYHRALHVIERRNVLRSMVPARGGTRDVSSLPEPAAVDPWAIDPATLPEQTRVIATCPECDGARRTTCGECGGTTRVACGECRGSGRVMGQRGMKNCPRCRGNRTQKCGECRGGTVDCGRCEAKGRVEAWLTVEREQLLQVKVAPWNVAAAAHPNVQAPSDFDIRPPCERIFDSGRQTESPPLVPGLAPELDGRTDRVLAQRVQSFRSTIWRVQFTNALGTGVVALVGDALALAPEPASELGPLRAARRWLVAVACAGALATVAAVVGYESQHPWFPNHGLGAGVAFASLAAVPCLLFAMAHALRSATARRSARAATCASAGGALALLSIFLVFAGRPRLASASTALANGDVRTALETARALVDLDEDAAAARVLLDRIRSSAIAASNSAAAACDLFLAEPWTDGQARASATTAIVSRIASEQARASSTEDADALDALAKVAAKVDAALADKIVGDASLARAHRCVAGQDLPGAAAAIETAIAHGVAETAVAATRERAAALAIQRLSAALSQASHRRTRAEGISSATEASQLFTRLTGKPSDPPLSAIAHWHESRVPNGSAPRPVDPAPASGEEAGRAPAPSAAPPPTGGTLLEPY